ncbi:MAG: pyridoxal phosphate-dependent aminotransferase family protein, partial [Candidatus Eisenbacteria bacterium]|nr:pyridoxal phosphate-dependent aminotransferase family protein [Candidatus Eisenbacteria bacterium]
ALSDKCREFNAWVDSLRAANQFFYLRQIDPAASPVVTMNGRKLIMLGSNNYLGLATHPKVVEATVKAVEEYGTGACSSRVLTGTTSLHNRLERKLAEFKRTEAAVVFSTGFMTMMGTISAMTEEGDVVLSDEFNHASIVEGCRLTGAEVKVYKHNDMASLEDELSKCGDSSNKLIVTDGVFSMKGTLGDLPGIKKLADRFGAAVMMDDAHGTGSIGATGRGTLEYFGMEGQIDFVCGTFSKSLGTIGGFTASTQEVVSYLKLRSRPFIFSASPPPSSMATVLACLEVIDEEPELMKRLGKNTDFLREGLADAGFRLEPTVTPIIPILIGDEEKTFLMAGGLEDEGVIVNPVVSPAVPKEGSLIRISVMASLADDELATALDKFKLVGGKLGLI